jgi:hypothetical protein
MATLTRGVGKPVPVVTTANKSFVIGGEVLSVVGALGTDTVEGQLVTAKMFVKRVFVEIVTPTGVPCLASVGDGTGATSWDASIDLNAAAGTITFSVAGTDAFATSGGKMYTAADSIDLKLLGTPAVAAALTVGAVKMWAEVISLA